MPHILVPAHVFFRARSQALAEMLQLVDVVDDADHRLALHEVVAPLGHGPAREGPGRLVR